MEHFQRIKSVLLLIVHISVYSFSLTLLLIALFLVWLWTDRATFVFVMCNLLLSCFQVLHWSLCVLLILACCSALNNALYPVSSYLANIIHYMTSKYLITVFPIEVKWAFRYNRVFRESKKVFSRNVGARIFHNICVQLSLRIVGWEVKLPNPFMTLLVALNPAFSGFT